MFIVIEGSGGVGKSTAISYLKEKYPEFEYFSDPSSDIKSISGIRTICKEETFTDEWSKLLLFVTSRIELSHKIKEALDKGKVVVCDRYKLSTYAYQGYYLGLDNVISLDHILKRKIPILQIDPDLYIIMGADDQLDRIKERSTKVNDKDVYDEDIKLMEHLDNFYKDFVENRELAGSSIITYFDTTGLSIASMYVELDKIIKDNLKGLI